MHVLRSTVYIPLIELTDNEDQLLEIYCEKQRFGQSELDNKSLDKDWHFVVAELRRIGLYENGLLAVNSVRKLGLKIPFSALYQRLKKYAWLDNQRLHYVNVLGCEGESSQLGLAIALLLNAGVSPIRYAIATGKLSNETQKNQYMDYDVAIDSIMGVQQKLQLLIRKRKANKLPNESLYFFTPYYQDKKEQYPVKDLAEIKELAALNINVKPIKWLSEAAKILHADKSRYLAQDKAILATTGMVSSLTLATLLYLSWWHSPIPVQILTGKNKAEPFLVCSNRDDSEVSYYELEQDGDMPLFPVFIKENIDYNVGIAWKLRATKTFLTTRYYVALIHLGEKTGLKIINKDAETKKDIIVNADETFEKLWPMNEDFTHKQDNILFLALQRTPIKVDEINQQFAMRFSKDKKLKILEARDFLLTQFSGSYYFLYKSILSEQPCIKHSF